MDQPEIKVEDVKQRFDDLCLDLNMDKLSKHAAWETYQTINMNYTLEGDAIHWLACALYVACRKSKNPTVGSKKVILGNCVSLTRLLRSAKLSLIEFFSKMKKWADMASLPSEFRDKLDRLERNFNVSTVIFKKFKPIFLKIFNDPANDPARPPRGRRQRRLPCTAGELLNFCWTLFINVKGHFSVISDDLVNSYHLLLCCIDWVYNNAIVSRREDLMNLSFPELPKDFMKEGTNLKEAPCIIQYLCEEHEGLEQEAKVIKEHYWKPYIRKLFWEKGGGLKGRADSLTGALEIGNFESNTKAVNNGYDEYVLTVGDFDERVFLGEDAATRIGTPAKTPPPMSRPRSAITMENLQQHLDQTMSLTPSTPLTNRRYLKSKDMPVTPISNATQSVSKLHNLLQGLKPEPGQALLEIFTVDCTKNPLEEIKVRMDNLGETFCEGYTKPSESGHIAGHVDFARKRLQLGQTLYYSVLENILQDEKKRLNGRKVDLSVLLGQDVFHQSLLACCLEIVLFSYNSQRAFPWIVDVFELNPFHFYKVIETIIRSEERLSRDVVKHLNHIEETILECLAWRNDSPVWEALKQAESTPTCEQVMFPDQVENDGGLNSPNKTIEALKRSPVTGGAVDRFGSPINPRRRLFQTSLPRPDGSKIITTKQIQISAEGGGEEPKTITFQRAIAEDGREVLIPVQLVPVRASEPEKGTKPRKQGSLALFFRKVYHLASVRVRDLCDRLEINTDLRGKIWTCFEYCLVHHVEIMRDRHLDQMIMCAIYVICKATNNDQQFQEIMRCYRQQPQAESHVYRSVLIESKRKQDDSAPQPSPAKDERRAAIRSSGTGPNAPPTPTRMLGTQASFETENRGDLIKFYNAIYVKKVKIFAMKFSQTSLEKGECPPLSPLPMIRSLPSSPRKLTGNHSIFVSPIKRAGPMSPSSKLTYQFEKSPAKNLRAINKMLQNGERKAMKRLQPDDAEDDEAESGNGAKRPCTAVGTNVLQQKLLGVVTERKQTNGTQ